MEHLSRKSKVIPYVSIQFVEVGISEIIKLNISRIKIIRIKKAIILLGFIFFLTDVIDRRKKLRSQFSK